MLARMISTLTIAWFLTLEYMNNNQINHHYILDEQTWKFPTCPVPHPYPYQLASPAQVSQAWQLALRLEALALPGWDHELDLANFEQISEACL